jgi:hypothetical protein
MALAEIINLTPVNIAYNTEFTFQIKVNNAPSSRFEMIYTHYSSDSRVNINRVGTSPYIYITNGISNTITAKAEAGFFLTGPLDFITAFQITLQNSPATSNYQHPNFVNRWVSDFYYVGPAGFSLPTLTLDSYQPEVEENQSIDFIFKSDIVATNLLFNYKIEGKPDDQGNANTSITVSDFNKTTLTGFELKTKYNAYPLSPDYIEENKYLFSTRIYHNSDNLAEGTELYRLVVYSQQFGVLVTTPYVSIFNVSTVTLINAPEQLEEGVTTTLTLRFLVPPPNYLYSWRARFVADPGNPLASAEDFVGGTGGGPNQVIVGDDGLPIYLGEFTLTPKYDRLLEQPFEYFTVDIENNAGTVIFTKIFKIGDANNPDSISATLTPSTTIIDNTITSLCQFAVNTLSIDPSGTLYWKIINDTSQDSDFKTTTGTIALQNKVGSFQVEINPEINPGSAVTKTFNVGVYFDPQRTQLIGTTSQPIQIIFNPIKYGILIKDKNKKVVYSSNDVTWNQVDYFFAQANTTTTKTYPALIGKDSRGVQALINAPVKERESIAHTIAINSSTGQVTVSGGNEQAYILVLTR